MITQHEYSAESHLYAIQKVADFQTDNTTLWKRADTEREVCLQAALKRLHEVIKGSFKK